MNSRVNREGWKSLENSLFTWGDPWDLHLRCEEHMRCWWLEVMLDMRSVVVDQADNDPWHSANASHMIMIPKVHMFSICHFRFIFKSFFFSRFGNGIHLFDRQWSRLQEAGRSPGTCPGLDRWFGSNQCEQLGQAGVCMLSTWPTSHRCWSAAAVEQHGRCQDGDGGRHCHTQAHDLRGADGSHIVGEGSVGSQQRSIGPQTSSCRTQCKDRSPKTTSEGNGLGRAPWGGPLCLWHHQRHDGIR